MSSIKDRLAQANQQVNPTSAQATREAMEQAKTSAEGSMAARTPVQGATAGAGGQAQPVTFNSMDIQRKVESYTADKVKERLHNSKAEITQLLAKQPNAYKVITAREGEGKLYPVAPALVEKVEGIDADTKFPLKEPKSARATIDGYLVRKPNPDGSLGAEEPMTKRQLGDWIKNFALVRIGTEERGARITEKRVLNAELPYTLSVWGLDASKDSDVTPTYDEDKEAAPANKRFYLNTGNSVFKDATNNEVKLFTVLPFPKYVRKPEFLEALGPIKMNRKAPPTSPMEIEDTLRTLAKITLLEDMKQQKAAD